jgi:hypothetical protein
MHDTRPITFCIIVDDLGVKYVGKEHAMMSWSDLPPKPKLGQAI